MTLQIGLVGTDGIVLGSDMQINVTEPGEDSLTISSQISKIFRNNERRTLAAWSGFNPARELARLIVDLPETDIRNDRRIETMASDVFDSESGKLGFDYGESDVILVTGGELTKICRIHVQRKSVCFWSIDKVIAGQTGNPSVYFIQRFYRKLSINNLTSLVAHTILDAGRHNPFGIKGLEIVYCSESGITALSRDRVSELEKMSQELESKIIDHLTPMVVD